MANPTHFLDVFLAGKASSLPRGSFWAVFFTDIKGIFPTIRNAYKGEPFAKEWLTVEAASQLLADPINTQEGIGCLFCQAIDLPGEGSTPVAEGTNLKYNSFIRGYVGAGRNDFPIMRMSFLETNISFADTILRGWALATAKYGMIARTEEGKKYRTNIDCYKFVSTPQGLQTKSKFSFKDACCISIDNHEINHDAQVTTIKRSAQFIYNSYTIDTVSGVPSELI